MPMDRAQNTDEAPSFLLDLPSDALIERLAIAAARIEEETAVIVAGHALLLKRQKTQTT